MRFWLLHDILDPKCGWLSRGSSLFKLPSFGCSPRLHPFSCVMCLKGVWGDLWNPELLITVHANAILAEMEFIDLRTHNFKEENHTHRTLDMQKMHNRCRSTPLNGCITASDHHHYIPSSILIFSHAIIVVPLWFVGRVSYCSMEDSQLECQLFFPQASSSPPFLFIALPCFLTLLSTSS